MNCDYELEEVNGEARSLSDCIWMIQCKACGNVIDDGESTWVEDLRMYDVIIWPKSMNDNPPNITYKLFESLYGMFDKPSLDKMEQEAKEELLEIYARDMSSIF